MRKNILTAGLMIIAALLAGLFLSGCGSLSSGAAASVNGTEISKDEVSARIRLGRALIAAHITSDWEEYFKGVAGQAQGTTIPEEFLQQAAVKQLVQEEIDRQEVESRGLSVSEEEVEAREQEILEVYFLSDEQKMEEEFAREDVTRADLRKQLLGELYSQKISDSLKAEITVGDEEVRTRYDAMAGSLVYPERRQIRQIVTADQATAQSIADRINAGENMTVIARESSIDQATASQAGRTDLLEREKFPKPVGDMAFSLLLNQLSPVFQSDLGWYVMRVEVINPASNRTLDGVRNEITDVIIGDKLSQELSDYDAENKVRYTVEYAAGYEPTKV